MLAKTFPGIPANRRTRSSFLILKLVTSRSYLHHKRYRPVDRRVPCPDYIFYAKREYMRKKSVNTSVRQKCEMNVAFV